jgi:catechol 2,3-dioxygenase-like lactoylglutathione lyase family enzyme
VVFYRELLGLDLVTDQGWYVELGSEGRVVLALVASGHPTVPAAAAGPPRGLLVSFEVDDAAAVAQRVAALHLTPVVDLVEELGQRHLMVFDPDGAVVDVIERVPFTAADLRRLAQYRRAHRCNA